MLLPMARYLTDVSVLILDTRGRFLMMISAMTITTVGFTPRQLRGTILSLLSQYIVFYLSVTLVLVDRTSYTHMRFISTKNSTR